MEAKIPGITAKHAVISNDCRDARGDDGAIDEALARIRAEAVIIMGLRRDVRLHVALVVETTS